MFTMSSFCPTLGWEYPIDQIVKDHQTFSYNLNLDSTFLVDFSTSSQAQNYGDHDHHHDHHHQFDHDHHVKRAQSDESPNGISSNDHQSSSLAKKLSHNASERVRRKKISNLYSSLRALLPTNHLKKKLSIPGTVVKVVEYIPELQQEVEDLIRKKKELLSKLSKLQGNARDFILEEKPKNCIINETTSFSISANKLGDKDLMIQISSFETIKLYEALLLLEKNGYFVVDVSSFQSFGGITFYNMHLSMEGSFTKNVQQLNEALQSLLQDQKQKQLQQPKIHFDLLNF